MVEVKRIKAPNDIPAYGGYVISWCCTDLPRWTGNIGGAEFSWCEMESGTRRSLTSLPQQSRPRKTFAETKHFQTVYEK
jgi:hypothetical protein